MNSTLAERVIVQVVHSGEWRIEPDGSVWRVAKRGHVSSRRGVVSKKSLVACNPVRVENFQPSGYRLVRVMIAGKRYVTPTHRLIWQFHFGDIPEGMQINHKNGVKSDNRIGNLEVCTPSENVLHAFRTGLKTGVRGERNNLARFSDSTVVEIRERYSRGESPIDIGRLLGVSHGHVCAIVGWSKRNGGTKPTRKRLAPRLPAERANALASKRELALELRRAGKTCAEIGRVIGFSKAHTWRLCKGAA